MRQATESSSAISSQEQIKKQETLCEILNKLEGSEYDSEKLKAVSPFAAAAYEGDATTLDDADLETIKTDYLLYFAVVGAIDRNNTHTLKYLLIAIAKINRNTTEYLEANDTHINLVLEGCTPLLIACWEGHAEVVQLLLDAGADPDVDINAPDDDDFDTPLVIACEKGHTEVVRLLLNKPDINVNRPDSRGDTALWLACKNGHTEIVQLLLNSPGIDVNQPKDRDNTALSIACINGHTEIVRLLLGAGADVNKLDNATCSPLYNACHEGYIKIVRMLLNHPKIDINLPDNFHHRTPLWIACYRGHMEVIQLLLDNPDIDVNQADDRGDTALSIACKNGHTEIVRLLLNAGADITQAGANEVLESLLAARRNTLRSHYLKRNQKDEKLLELNKIAYLLSENWDMSHKTLAAMVRSGQLYYKAKAESIQKKIITIYSGVFKNDEGEDKRVKVFTSEEPKELLYSVLPPELWEIVFMDMIDDASLPADETPLRNLLEALDKVDRKKAVAPRTNTQAGLLANSTVATTATPIARDATPEEMTAVESSAAVGPNSS